MLAFKVFVLLESVLFEPGSFLCYLLVLPLELPLQLPLLAQQAFQGFDVFLAHDGPFTNALRLRVVQRQLSLQCYLLALQIFQQLFGLLLPKLQLLGIDHFLLHSLCWR